MKAKFKLLAGIAAIVALAAGAQIAAQVGPALSAPAPSAPQTEQTAVPAVSIVDQKMIDLAAAYPKLEPAKGKTFRARKVMLAPGARTPEVDGGQHPSIFFVTQGAVVEHRSDRPDATEHALHAAGSISKGITHWVENTSAEPAELLVMDILPTPAP